MISSAHEKVKNYILENGLCVVLYKDVKRVSCDIDFIFNVGSKDDTRKLSGLSHFCEHLLFSGNKVDTKEQLEKRFDDYGARVNAKTTREYTNLYCTVMSKYLQNVLLCMKNMIVHTEIDNDKIENEKSIIKLEIKQETKSDMIKSMLKDIYGKNAYKLSVRGNLESVNNIAAKDVQRHFKKYFNPQNAVLLISGRIPKNILETIETIFGDWQGNTIIKRNNINHNWINEIAISTDHHNDEVNILGGWYVGCDGNFAVRSIANELIRGFLEDYLREQKKYVYSICRYEYNIIDHNYVFFKTYAEKKNVKEIKEIFESLCYLSIDEEDFKRIKNKKILDYSMDTENIASILTEIVESKLLSKEYINPNQKLRMYKNVSLKDVQEYIKRNFSNPKIFLKGNITKHDLE